MALWPDRILHIDDDPMILELVKTVFERSGRHLEIKSCDNGSDAVNMADTFRPDLILLDVNMPGMKAGEILTRLGRGPSPKAVPVILVTGYSKIPDDILQDSKDSAIIGTIKKPISPDSFLEDIKTIWNKKHNL